jgi:hypothetical protein
MKILILILILALSVFSQKIATTEDGETVILKPNKTWEYAVKNKPAKNLIYGWSVLTKTEDTPEGITFYFQPEKVKTNSIDQKTTWIRSIPMYPAVFIKKNKLPVNLAYILQFLTVDCDSERYSIESTVFYDKKDEIIKTSKYWGSAFYNKPIPGTIAESFVNKLCR